MDRYEIEGHEVIDGTAKATGNGAHVLVPKRWRGADVKVVERPIRTTSKTLRCTTTTGIELIRPAALEQRLAWTVDTCRQVYNHFLHRLNRNDGTSAHSEQKLLPSLKQWWNELTDVHSKVLQKVVQRLYDNLSRLADAKKAGRKVGRLKWKAPGEYRSFTYSQSGFELKNTSGRTRLWLSKLGDIPIRLHRDIPDESTIKQVTVKREPTGKWYAILGIETPDDPPENQRIQNGVSVST